MGSLHRSEFLSELKRLFPELSEAADKRDSSFDPDMHEFERLVNVSIAIGDESLVRTAFQLVDRVLEEGDDELKMTTTASFLKHVNFENGVINRSWAAKLMPPRVSESYGEIKLGRSRSGTLT